MTSTLLSFVSFCVVSMSAHLFGKFVAPLGLPTITVFIGFGLACGPFALGLISDADSTRLSWINNVALGFIGFSAGGHFHISDMKAVIPTASVVLLSLVVVTFGGVVACVITLGPTFIPFFATLDSSQQMAAALLFGCLAVARSPSSAIALIAELNARGPFTSTVLAVTCMMDVMVVILFSVTLTVARTLDSHEPSGSHHRLLSGGGDASSGESLALAVLEEFVTEVGLSGLSGVLLGFLVPFAISFAPKAKEWPAAAGFLALIGAAIALGLRVAVVGFQRLLLPGLGWALFYEEELAHHDPAWEAGAWLNPLICSMTAGFIVVNFTGGGHAFHEVSDAVSGPIFLLFFVYTGVSMNVGALVRNVPICMLVFTSRALLVYISTTIGGKLAGSSPTHTSLYWMTFLTQAGVTLGLANSAAVYFTWGEDFVAGIIAVCVLNQIVGPVLMKKALRGAGEDHHDYVPVSKHHAAEESIGYANVPTTTLPQPRGAVVVCEPGDATAELCVSRLRARGWEVIECDHQLAVRDAGGLTATLESHAHYELMRLPANLRHDVETEHTANPWSKLKMSVKTAKAVGGGFSSPRNASSGPSTPPSTKSTTSSPRKATPPGIRGPSMKKITPPGAGKTEEAPTRRGMTRQKTVRESIQQKLEEKKEKETAKPRLRGVLQPPTVPAIKEIAGDDSEKYSRCLRLLWLKASMRSLDVVISLLPTDDENLSIAELVADMNPALKATHAPSDHTAHTPQLVVSLKNADDLAEMHELLEPAPLVIPRQDTLASLVCEVLHPSAHWSGVLGEGLVTPVTKGAGKSGVELL